MLAVEGACCCRYLALKTCGGAAAACDTAMQSSVALLSVSRQQLQLHARLGLCV